jgi:putative FmdB family regulatory protein
MPTYTYHCDNCGVTFDKYQKFEDKALTRCPECRKGTLRRVVSAPAIVFKGSGWYKTDSRTNSTSTSTGKGDKSESSEKAEKGDKKAEKAEKASTGDGQPASKETKEAAAPAKSEPAKSAKASD